MVAIRGQGQEAGQVDANHPFAGQGDVSGDSANGDIIANDDGTGGDGDPGFRHGRNLGGGGQTKFIQGGIKVDQAVGGKVENGFTGELLADGRFRSGLADPGIGLEEGCDRNGLLLSPRQSR
jgi:hypothetical protein